MGGGGGVLGAGVEVGLAASAQTKDGLEHREQKLVSAFCLAGTYCSRNYRLKNP